MKRSTIVMILALLVFFSCNNPVNNNPAKISPGDIPGIQLTEQDQSEITALARHFSQRKIDRISVDSTRYFGWILIHEPRENDFTGTVQFDSVYVDTDIISYQNLTFYNKYWYNYSMDGLPDSQRVWVKNWYSSQHRFNVSEKTVFKVDSLRIIASTNDALKKADLIGYLKAIAVLSAASVDTNQQKALAGFSLENVTNIHSYVSQDTATIGLSCGNESMTTYVFAFVNGNFKNIFLRVLLF